MRVKGEGATLLCARVHKDPGLLTFMALNNNRVPRARKVRELEANSTGYLMYHPVSGLIGEDGAKYQAHKVHPIGLR